MGGLKDAKKAIWGSWPRHTGSLEALRYNPGLQKTRTAVKDLHMQVPSKEEKTKHLRQLVSGTCNSADAASSPVPIQVSTTLTVKLIDVVICYIGYHISE